MGRLRRSSSNSSETESRKSCNRGHWRPAEDDRLRKFVKHYGPHNWNFISEHLEGRSGKSCRLRWYNQLNPNIVKKPFTGKEEEMLLALQKVKGNKWAAIARFFPGRTDNAVKNHFHVLMARRKRDRLALFGDDETNMGHKYSTIDFISQNHNKNTGIFGASSSHASTDPLILISGSSTVTSSFDASGVASKAHKEYSIVSSIAGEKSSSYGLNNFPSYSNNSPSTVLGSYHRFTAPAIPTIGKIGPFHRNFLDSSDYGHTTEDSIKGRNTGKHPHALCKLPSMNTCEQQQPRPEPLKQEGVIPFIDFLGVGSSSAHDDSIRGPASSAIQSYIASAI